MSGHKEASPKEMMFVGAIAAAAGIYFMLVGFGVLPIPGGPRNLHGPLWVVFCAGLAFFLGGLAVFLQGVTRAERGELPAGSPHWLRAIHLLMGLTIFICFGAIASWIAFGPGARSFSGSFLFFSAEMNAIIGRAAFGIGAIIIWLCTIAFAVSSYRKLFRAPGNSAD
jgi:hypothetical protein